MEISVDVKFGINEKVLVKTPHVGAYLNYRDEEGIVVGYVIHKTDKQTKIYYKVDLLNHQGYKNKRYVASELEKIVEE